jgi:DNA-binding XRE family transcriptional regulator
MSVQIIKQGDKPEWAVVPYEVYLQLIEDAEMLQDVKEYDRVKAALDAGDEEVIPGEVVDAILDGANPIKVWREFRGLSQQDVAERIGISIPYLSQLETGKRRGSFAVLSTLARALGVPLDSLAAQDSE